MNPIDAVLDIFRTNPQLFVSLHVMIIVVHVLLLTVAYLIYLERKISAYIQDRIGPNRVGFDFGLPALKVLSTDGPFRGFWGLGQPLADGLKFLLKEDYAPNNVDRVLFTLAPIMIITPALIGFMVIPWGGIWEIPPGFTLPFIGEFEPGPVMLAGADVNVGVIYLLAIASVGVYGVTLGGWASNSKYSFLGGLRATAQMISYEIPLGLTLLCALLAVGTLMPHEMIQAQAEGGWLVFSQPIAALIFFFCILAEANRAPFDNAEAEQELVGGYHTEYSSMRFALFFLAEYSHMITSAAFLVLLFFGGYHLWGVPALQPEATGFLAGLLKFLVFFGKVVLIVCFEMVIRWTLPRLRYDQVMMLGWQSLIPISLGLLVATSFMVFAGWTEWWQMLAMNVGAAALIWAGQTVLPRSTVNRRISLYGSRFNPVPGLGVTTQPTDPLALEDRPHQGTDVGMGLGSRSPAV